MQVVSKFKEHAASKTGFLNVEPSLLQSKLKIHLIYNFQIQTIYSVAIAKAVEESDQSIEFLTAQNNVSTHFTNYLNSRYLLKILLRKLNEFLRNSFLRCWRKKSVNICE